MKWLLPLLTLSLLITGCALNAEPEGESTPFKEPTVNSLAPTAAPIVSVRPVNYAPGQFAQSASRTRFQAVRCVYPAGWQAYRVQDAETSALLAARHRLSLTEWLRANCLSPESVLGVGQVVYVPPPMSQSAPNTVLPLGVSAFTASTLLAQPGSPITLSWQGQGEVRSVRVGWLSGNQFIQEAAGLPVSGTWGFTIPDDGREMMTFALFVGDGSREVYALTTVQIACRESWFFAPAPQGCPSPALTTEFVEQRFEHGTIVFIPALGVHYVLVVGQEAQRFLDEYVPGMPLNDGLHPVPAGYASAQGAMYYVWRQEGVRQALGYPIEAETSYQGSLQRTLRQSGEVMYLSASSGHVYRIGTGLVWGVLIPQPAAAPQ